MDPGVGSRAVTSAGRPYTIQPGDSLWSIAQSLLGQNASPAAIARMVAQIWSLNAERIASGTPDLILVGENLRLPS